MATPCGEWLESCRGNSFLIQVGHRHRGKALDTMEEMFSILGLAAEFRKRFEAEKETINCRELTGADLSSEEGLKQYMSSDTPQTVCFPAVGTAYRLVVDLLEETA